MALAGIVDAQSVKDADTVGKPSRGYDAGKKVNGRQRHVVVDTIGLLVAALITAASIQDRGGGRLVLDRARMKMPSITLAGPTAATPDAAWTSPAGCCASPWKW